MKRMENIKSNGIARETVSLSDLPESARGDFDYIDSEEEFTPRLVQYRGVWYDVFDSQVNRNHGGFTSQPFPKYWDGYVSDSFFSAVLFHFKDEDTDLVVCGTYIN
tara:strand:- start:1554 stop:1871 length:318 start_codon:yes stop_codon:yes gene_type:complete